MADAGIDYNLSNDAAEIGRFKYMVTLGDSYVQIAEQGNPNVSATGTLGWDFLGYSTGIQANNKPEYYPIKTGSPETLKGNIIVGQALDYAFTFNMLSYTGWKLSNGNDLAATINYAMDGQTTISSATQNTGTVADATGLAVGDKVLIDLTNGTNGSYASSGSFMAIAAIVKITGTAVQFTRIAQVPTNGSDFKKIAGYPALTGAGIQFKMGGGNVKGVQLRVVSMSIPDKMIIIDYHSQVDLINPTSLTRNDRKLAMTLGLTAAIIPTYESVLDDNGITSVQPILGDRYYLPYSSITP